MCLAPPTIAGTEAEPTVVDETADCSARAAMSSRACRGDVSPPLEGMCTVKPP